MTMKLNVNANFYIFSKNGNGIIIRKNGVGQYGNFSYHFHPWICYSLYFEKIILLFMKYPEQRGTKTIVFLSKRKTLSTFFFEKPGLYFT